MLNVINFQKGAPRSPALRAKPAAANANIDIAAVASRIISLQSQAKGKIQKAVLMLDLAAEHARKIAAEISDPAAKKDFDEHISMIERLLGLAREMAFKL